MAIHILHLSDLHFGTLDNAENWANHLKADLKQEQDCDALDALVVSGDAATLAVEEEFNAAQAFLEKISTAFSLDPSRLVIVPGNHDLNWGDSRKAYSFMYREDYTGKLEGGNYIEASNGLVGVRDEQEYKARFLRFSQFYEVVKKEQYPLEYDRQAIACEIKEKNLLIFGFNSAWQVDHYFTARASINPTAVTHALNTIMDMKRFQNYLKIAVWHHPLESPDEARIKDHGFLDRLTQCGFSLALHGHLHKAMADQYRYELGPDGRRIHIVGAGTFGALSKDWYPGYPLQYNLIRIDGNVVTVNTRCRREPEGAWAPDAIWLQGKGKSPLDYYTITLAPQTEPTCVPARGPEVGAGQRELPYRYKIWLDDQCKEMDLTRLIGTSPVIRATLPEIFVPLFANPPEAKEETDSDKPNMHRMEERARDIEDLIAERECLVIEGGAGSGKTTLVKHTAYMVLHDPDGRGLGGWLPLLVFLKELKEADFKFPDDGSDSFKFILSKYFERSGCGLDLEVIQSFCSAKRTLFLLDGLDELAPPLRRQFADSLASFKRENPGCRFVLSGRPHGVDYSVQRWFGKDRIAINPLNMGQVEDFIKRWFIHVFERRTQRITKTAEDMIGEIKAHPSIERLIENPLLLTAVCLLYNDEKELPGQRAELYQKFIENLLHRRFEGDMVEKVRNILMELALRMHVNEKTKVIDKAVALSVLRTEYPRHEGETNLQYGMRLEREFDEIEPKCALLKCDSGGYEFHHLTFQEYLAAAAIATREQENFSNAISIFWDDPWYAEMIELYVSYLGINSKGIANKIIRNQFKKDEEPPFYRWQLAARSLLDIHRGKREASGVTLAKERLWQIVESGVEAKVCAEAGELIGRLGDDRDLKVFVPVKGGSYRLSRGEFTIKEFEMGKYPVTNQWFGEFYKAGGYTDLKYWSEQGKLWLEGNKVQNPAFWFEWKWNCPNAPVVGVSWYEADAFTRWLTLARKDGWRYFLPDENQWEAAAAGKEGRTYPWGNEWQEDHCNSGESGIKKTSPVGIFPKGNTAEGIVDMSGNVWEWASSDYHSKQPMNDFRFDEDMQKLYELIIKGHEERDKYRVQYEKKLNERGRQFPVLRGGSWGYFRYYVCCGYRGRLDPNDRLSLIGFRCARTKC